MVGGSPRLDMGGCRQGGEPGIPCELLCGSNKGRDNSGCRSGYAFGTDWNSGFRVGQEKGRGMFDPRQQTVCRDQANPPYRALTLPGQMFESRRSLCESGTSSFADNFDTPTLLFALGTGDDMHALELTLLYTLVVAFSRRLYCIETPHYFEMGGTFLTIYEHCRTCTSDNSS